MRNFKLVEPLIEATWVVDGQTVASPPGDSDALYIRPMLHRKGAVPAATNVLHSLVLDNNVLTDLIEGRRSANTEYLEDLLRSKPLELNPVLAMFEQRQKFGGASQALHAYAKLLEQRFGARTAKRNAGIFDSLLEAGKPDLARNIELLSGYLPAILFIYHQPGSARFKLEWLSELIKSVNLPILQLPFYLAAMLFLVKEQPTLFRTKVIGKVRQDTKLQASLDEQKKAVLNLGHDVMLPAMALFPAGLVNTLVFPYIATRDYLLQDFLGEIRCDAVLALSDGRANGAWKLNPNGRLHTHLGAEVDNFLTYRLDPGCKSERSVRRANLHAFSDSYLSKCLALQQAMRPESQEGNAVLE